MKFLIRVDASHLIGSGHVIRCLNLARELKKNGHNILFLSRNHKANYNNYLKSVGFAVCALPQKKFLKKEKNLYRTWLGCSEEQDSSESKKIINKFDPEFIIVDHYGLSAKWESRVRKQGRKIIVIDDLAQKKHDCDIIVNSSPIKNLKKRYQGLIPKTALIMTGSKCAILSNEIRNTTSKLKKKLRKILIYFGSSDKNNLALEALKVLCEKPFKNLNVVVIKNNNKKFTIKQCKKRKLTKVFHFVKHMGKLLKSVDLVLGAGGVNLLERILVGVPSLTNIVEKNQIQSAKNWGKKGVTKYLGYYKKKTIKIWRSKILQFLRKPEILKKMSYNCLKYKTEIGNENFAWILKKKFCPNSWKIRKAKIFDCRLFWDWANDPSVRKFAFTRSQIPWLIHRKWFKKRLAQPNCIFYIVESPWGPVGQIRFDTSQSCAFLDYSIGHLFRKLNLGKKLLKMGIDKFRKTKRLPILAEIRPENIASKCVLRSLGFRPFHSESNSKLKFILN